MLAQSLVEYGALSSVVAALRNAADSIASRVSDLSPREWAIVGTVALAALLLWTRGGRRL
jgi:ABC-type sulfate transport system permease subunit